MNIQLSDHFDYKRLLRFVAPSIIMMVFTSIYGVVDGLFVSNFVGDTAFAAINLIMPVNSILGGVGFMLGTGGSALVAKLLGEQKKGEGKPLFYHDDLDFGNRRHSAFGGRLSCDAPRRTFAGRD